LTNQKVRLPNKQGVVELNDDDESQADEHDAQVEQQHQTADAPGVRTKGARRRHRFHDGAALPRHFALDRDGL